MSKSHKTYTLAITGSIGCGKSAVRKCLEEAGVAVLDTDKIAHELLSKPNPIYRAILQRFGEDLVDAPNGPINRKKLGAIVFADRKAREELNALMHPAIRLVCEQRIKALNTDIVAVEVPLVFESGQQDEYDEVWAVLAESSVRLKRLMERDSITAEQAQMRINAQWAQEKKAALAQRIIDNSGTMDNTAAQVVACLAKARAAAKQNADEQAEQAASREYREILKRFGYFSTEQALEQMGDLSTTEHKEANASMTLVVDSANPDGGDHNRRELQVDVHMSVKQSMPPPSPPDPSPIPPPPTRKKRNCWWLFGVLLAAIIAFWVIHPSPSVHDPGGVSHPPPVVQTGPPPTPPPLVPPPVSTSTEYPAGSVEHFADTPRFIVQNVHNLVRARVIDWKLQWSADGRGAVVATGIDSSGRTVNVEHYGANLTFEYQWNIAYNAGSVQVDRFEAFNDFVGRTIYLFNSNGALVSVRQLDGNQRLLTEARFDRASGQLAVRLNFFDEVSGRLIRSTTIGASDLRSALSQRFYLSDMFGQLN